MNSFKKLIILDHEPFSERKKSHYFIDSFFEHGISVEYWNLHNLLSYGQDIVYSYAFEAEYVVKFENFEDFIKRLTAIDASNTVLIVECWFDLTTVQLFKTIQEKSLHWVKIDYYCNPTMYLNPPLTLYKRLVYNKGNILSKIFNYLKTRRFRRERLDIPHVLFLTGSDKGNSPRSIETASLNYFDIEEYHNKKGNPRILEYKYIVFLDIMLVDHPDSQRLGYDEVVPRALYFKRLNNFFEVIEKKTGLPVVIASHPKANYTNEFEHRLCLKNKTAELSIGAEVIVTHGSLSISYALLAEKPLIYVYYEELFKKNDELNLLVYRMKKACQLLGTPMINIETEDFDFIIPTPSQELYQNFLDLLYHSTISTQVSNFDILLDKLNHLCGKSAN